MDFIKKHLVSLVSAVMAIAAVLVLVLYLDGLAGDLKTQAEKSLALQKKAKAVLDRKRFVPNLSAGSTDRVPLDGFPSDTAITSVEKGIEPVVLDVKRQLEPKLHVTAWTPLLPEVFGTAAGMKGSAPVRFREIYLQSLQGLVANLKPTDRPTAADYQFATGTVDAGTDGTKAEAQRQARRRKVAQDKAEMGKVLAGDYRRCLTVLNLPDRPVVADMWAAQVSYWIQKDICEAIGELNKPAKNVTDAVVKQIVYIDAPAMYITERGPVQVGPSAVGAKVEAVDRPGRFANASQFSPFNRVSGRDFDVVHVSADVVVDSRRVTDLIDEIENSRGMTVMSVDVMGVDRQAAANAGYYFGDAPCARVKIRIEVLFPKSFSQKLMPQAARDTMEGRGRMGGRFGEPE